MKTSRKSINGFVGVGNLRERLLWLVRLRWMACLGLVLTISVAGGVLGVVKDTRPLYFLNGLLALANVAYWLDLKWNWRKAEASIRRRALVQSVTDLVFLTVLLHFSGGVENPFLFFFIFHVIIASILFSGRLCYVEAVLAVGLFGTMVIFEYLRILPHHPLEHIGAAGLHADGHFISGALASFVTTVFFGAYLAHQVSGKLRQKELELSEERDKVASMIEGMHEGVVFIDSSFAIRKANRQAQELLWPGEDPPLGRNVLDTPLLVDEERRSLLEITSGRRNSFSCQRQLPNGDFAIQTMSDVRRPDGTLLGVILVWEDISDVKKMEIDLRKRNEELKTYNEKIERSEKKLAGATEKIVELLREAEREGSFEVRYHNPHLKKCWVELKCDKTDCPAYGSENLRCWQVAPQHCPKVYRKEIEVCADCKVFRDSIPDKLTEIGEAFNNMMNILQQKVNLTHELQAQLVHQEKMAGVGQMGAGLAHEIGNPLASISSLIQMLLKKKEAGDIREKLALVSFHIGRISKIVRQLADFSRPGGLTWGLVNLNDLLKEAVNIVQYDRKASNLTFTLELAEDLPEVFVVADEILQVFFNILQNAVDASSHEGTIFIRTWAEEPNVCASFEDKGTGMTAAEMQRIFEPFYTTKEPGKGTGLGLSISYSIVQKHKGKIEVQSQKNRGSTFSVKLPRARERVPL